MNTIPDSLAEVSKIYFIAEDATGPFRKVIKILLANGGLLSFEKKDECQRLICWLYDQNIGVATELERLLQDKEGRQFEAIVFRNGDIQP